MEIDRVDRQLIHALRIDGRASFARLSGLLGVSGQTIARRYRRLREAGAIRVVVMPGANAPGQAWLVRLQVTSGAAERVATAIAKRPDASWVSIVAGGSEILWASRPVTQQQTDALLLQRLPASTLITGVSAYMVLRTFDDPDVREWSSRDALTPEQREALSASREGAEPASAPAPEREDAVLLEVLQHDGRSSYAQLAAAAGISPARARRRLTALLAGDALRVELEIAIAQLGVPTRVWMWMRVSPAELEQVGQAISQLTETVYVAAVTGAVNLVAVVVVPDTATLYRSITRRLGALSAVRDIEIAPVLRQVKHEGSIPHAGRLPRPGEDDDRQPGPQPPRRTHGQRPSASNWPHEPPHASSASAGSVRAAVVGQPRGQVSRGDARAAASYPL